MEHIGKFVLYLILAVNALFVGMLILSAYSPYLQPKIHPIASCLGLAFPIFLAVNICFTLFWVIISFHRKANVFNGFGNIPFIAIIFLDMFQFQNRIHLINLLNCSISLL